MDNRRAGKASLDPSTLQVCSEQMDDDAMPGPDANGPNQDFAVYVYNAQ